MRKLIPLFVILTLLSAGFIASPASARSEKLTTINLQESELSNQFTFEQLGYAEKVMVGPFDSTRLAFSLPANVKLAAGSSVLVKYVLAWGGTSQSDATLTSGVAGTLLVYFNDVLIDTIVLQGGLQQEKEILIPAEALNSVAPDGRNQLRLFLNADVNCRYDDLVTTLIVSKTSLFNFQYEQVSPVVDLTLFPRPIFQPDSILPSSVLVVVPDQPEAFEMQAALNTVAGLGSITNGELNVKLVKNGNLTPEMVAANHLIFVGLAKNFSNLQAVDFPIPVAASGVGIPQDKADDGIIEAGLSPWSQAHVVLYVGGNSEDAVVKASQTLSTGKIIAVEKPDISLISSVNPMSAEGTPQVDQTFQSLGYPSQAMGVYGENYLSYVFYASPEQANSVGAYIDLVLSHSDLLDYESTGVTISLNEEIVGSVRFTEETPVIEQIKLVPGVLRRGINRLEIFAELIPFYSCYSNNLLSTWININETSTIHMPFSEDKLNFTNTANLRDFPYMFLTDRNLGDLAFILAADDQISWENASQVAYYIGAKGTIPLSNIHVAYADDVSDEVLNQYSLLVFGRASTLPVLSKLHDMLPAPFESGSDEAIQPSMQVNYSLLPDTSVGYLQMLPSPWNNDRVILAVLGNTIDGIPMAGATLTKDELVARLAGNFAVLYADQVVTTDTRLGVSKDSIISQLPVAVTVTPAAEVSAPSGAVPQIQSKPQWILPVVGFVTVLILGFLVFMLRRESNANRKPKESKPSDDSTDIASKNF